MASDEFFLGLVLGSFCSDSGTPPEPPTPTQHPYPPVPERTEKGPVSSWVRESRDEPEQLGTDGTAFTEYISTLSTFGYLQSTGNEDDNTCEFTFPDQKKRGA